MKHNMAKTIWIAGCLLVAGSPTALGQWQTQSFDLEPGWNAIYTHVDTMHSGIAALASGTQVEEVWMWQPPASTAQYVTTPDLPSDAKSRWASWKSGLGDNSSVLKRMPGNSAYLVKLGGSANYTWSVKGKPVAPRYQWTTSGLNFFGVPSVPSSPKSLEDYFGYAGYLLQNTQIFAYGGGDISATNPGQVYGLRTTLAKRGQAYWMDAGTQFNRYFGPFSVKLQSLSGAHFGDYLSAYRLRLRNMTSADLTVSLAGVNSETVPTGETAIAGAAPVLVRGALDTTTLGYAHSVLSDGAQSWTLQPAGAIGSEVEVVLGLNRTAMSGAAGTLYASLLRFTDSLGHSQVDIPVSGKVGTSEGLWIGAVGVTKVRHSLATDTTTFGDVGSEFPMRLIMHKEKFSGVTTVNSGITVGSGVTAGAAATRSNGVTVIVSATPRAYSTGDILTFSGGGVLTLTAAAAAGATSLTGDLAVADIANAETVSAAVGQGTNVSVSVGGLPRAYRSGDQVAFSGGGVLILTADAAAGATTLTGDLTGANIADGETAKSGGDRASGTNPGITVGSSVTATADATQGDGVTVSVAPFFGPMATGSVLIFPGGGELTLTADAAFGATSLTGDLTVADIANTETVDLDWGTVAQGSGVSFYVSPIPDAFKAGDLLEFSGGGKLTLTAPVSSGATRLTGDLAAADVAHAETVVSWTAGETGVSVAVTGLSRPLYSGEKIVFGGGGSLTLTSNAPANTTLLTGTLSGADLASGENGTADRIKLLQRAFVGTLASGNVGVAVKQSLLDAGKLDGAQRVSCVHLPVSESGLPWVCGGDIGSGKSVSVSVDIGYNDQASNPFVHTYHPDHDNLAADFKATQPVGRESYRIKRDIKLTFEPPGSGFVSLTRTGRQLIGTYEETLTLYGLATSGAANEKSYAMKGAIVLNRISDIATLETE
ncbi:hypothetical protein N8697_01385 [bacterium]|nr:hypothetical protein [bacterium]